jgi:N-acetylglucosamine-6-phosphate deacetylase
VNKSETLARHWLTQREVRLRWADGVITGLEELPGLEPQPVRWWLAPGLFDVQVSGYAGVDFQRDEPGAGALLEAVRGLRAAGCLRFLLTLMTDEWSRLTARLRRLRALRAQSLELRAAIAGWHIEGPFLSAEPGFHGAHDPALMLDPRPEHIHELRSLTETDPLLITLAPERPGALGGIALAASLGARVSLGHTDASADVLARAAAAGATGFTHLGNACPQALDRHDNILWRVLDGPELHVSLIPDRLHVSPPFLRLAHRLLPAHRIVHTTDAVAAAGAAPGRYTVGRMIVEVGADQVVRQPGRTNFAGSALRPIEGVARAAEMIGRPWHELWRHLSQVPADWMGISAGLAVGDRADFCLIDPAEDGRIRRLRVFVGGREAEERPMDLLDGKARQPGLGFEQAD